MAGVQGPETGQTPPTPEQAAAERLQAYIQQKAQQIREAFQRSVREFRDKFNEIKPQADEVEAMEQEGRETAGDPTNEAESTSKNKELQTNTWSQETLKLLKEAPDRNQLYDDLGLDPNSRRVLNALADTIQQHPADAKGMTYLYKLINKTLNNNIQNPLNAVSRDEFKNLGRLNPILHNQLGVSLVNAARQGNIDRRQIQKFIEERNREVQGVVQEGALGSTRYGELAFLDMFERLETDEARRAVELFRGIESTNVDDFLVYYRRYLREITEGIRTREQNRPENQRLNVEQIQKEAEEQIVHNIHESILYVTNQIYSTTLAQHPELNFDQTAAQHGTSFAPPDRIFNEAVFGKLSRLADNAKDYKGTIPLNLLNYRRRATLSYNETLEREIETEVPTAQLEKVGISKFTESLREIAQIEKGALRFQYNLMWLIHHPQGADQGGIFGTIQRFATENIKTETIDQLYILPHNELIQAGIMSLEPMYERMFLRHDWHKSPKLETELFEQLTPAEIKARDQLLEFYSDRPAWAVNRALYHARLMSFGKELKLHLLSSYADPYLKPEGSSTYLGEGIFAKNSTFDIWEGAKRWGKGTDAYINGLPTMAWSGKPNKYHPVEDQDDSEKRWRDSFTHGLMSYFENKHLREFNPMMSLHNVTRMGGVDGYGGWRMKYSYMHWLDKLINIKNHKLDLSQENDQLFVEGWKTIENIGTNVLKHYTEEYVSGADQESFIKHQTKYKEFFQFLYKRYFSNGIGKSMYSDTINNEQKFWEHISEQITKTDKKYMTKATVTDILNTHIYNALTVVLSERMPSALLLMEKKRSSQNGATLKQELLEEFVHGDNARWKQGNETEHDIFENKWEKALDDLIFVQQVARIESIRDMKDAVRQAILADDPNKHGVLFGNLARNESSIRYKIDSEYLVRILNRRYANDPQRAQRVQRAKEFYDRMMEKMKQKPKEGKLEMTWSQEFELDENGEVKKDEHDRPIRNILYDKKKYEEAGEWTKKRGNWFADTWKSYGFGMQFTADTAGQFMDRSATGEETIARTAEACKVVAEATKNYVAGGGFLEGMNGAVRNGRKSWDELHKGIADVYKSAKSEDTDKAKEITRNLVNWAVMGLRRDDRARNPAGRLKFQMERRKTSIASVKVGEGPAFDWDADDIYDFVLMFTEKHILSQYTREEDKQYKEVHLKGIKKVIAKITGKEYVRDYSREVLSGEAVRKMNRAGKSEVFQEHFLPAMGLAVIALAFVIMKKALEEEEKQ